MEQWHTLRSLPRPSPSRKARGARKERRRGTARSSSTTARRPAKPALRSPATVRANRDTANPATRLHPGTAPPDLYTAHPLG
ncbi:hypothetical protein, partial [Nonomuraea angiospora]|uniref:hypothetical protein n=1 Tax=Nonomuraea angiospora TaxID=46172 RepID=UPI0029B0AEDC